MALHDPNDGIRAHPRGYGDVERMPPRRRGMGSALIVTAGLGIFGGIIWYAYSQGMRAGTESVAPILRADPGPTKIRPEQPGGMDVPHQDKLVYNRLNPTRTDDPGVERLLPPPEMPLGKPQAVEAPPELPAETPLEPAGMAQAEADVPALQAPESPDIAGMALSGSAEEMPVATAEPVPLTAVPPAVRTTPPQPSGTAHSAPPQTTAAATMAAPARQTEPAPAPAAVKSPSVQAPAQLAAVPKASEPAKPAPAAGGVRIQIAAVDSESKAQSEWNRLQKRFPAQLGGLGLRVVRADLGAKGIFYRIQGGPVAESRAQEICSALKAQNVGCILVRN